MTAQDPTSLCPLLLWTCSQVELPSGSSQNSPSKGMSMVGAFGSEGLAGCPGLSSQRSWACARPVLRRRHTGFAAGQAGAMVMPPCTLQDGLGLVHLEP